MSRVPIIKSSEPALTFADAIAARSLARRPVVPSVETKEPVGSDYVSISVAPLVLPSGPSLRSERAFLASPAGWVLLSAGQRLVRGIPESPSARRELHKGRRAGGAHSTGGSSLPPEIQGVITCRARRYFLVEVTGTVNVGLSDRTIRGALGTTCVVTNSKVMPWAGSIRVNSLSVWPSASTSAGSVVDLYWVSTGTEFIKDDEKMRVVPDGVTVTGRVKFTPPKDSLAGAWISDAGAATNLCGVSFPNGSVVELDVSWTLSNNITAVQSTITTGVLGTNYYLALDGPSSNKIVPLAVPTTS